MGEILESILSTFTPSAVTSYVIWVIIAIFVFSLVMAFTRKLNEFVQYTPTLLTTLGIFGTFVGIVIGLLDFDHTNIDSSISALLDGLKTAFITSLCGMASSLLFKVITTLFLRPEINEDGISEATPELILATMQAQVNETKSLKAALIGNDDSTLFGQVKILRSDLNDNSKLNRQLQEKQFEQQQVKFEDFSEKLWIKMQDFADTLSKSATEQVIEALKQVIVDFNNNLTEQFGENFKRLNDAVLKLVEWQENYKNQLIEMEKQYKQGVTAITATEVSIAHISEKSQAIPKTMENLSDVMTVNQNQLAELERHLEAFKDMRDKAVEAVPEIRQQIENTVTEISKSVDLASSHYSELLTKSDDYINKHIETSESLLQKFLHETKQGIDAVGNRLIEGSEKIENSISTAAVNFVDKTNNGVEQIGAKLIEGSQSIEKSIDTAAVNFVDKTNNGVEQIGAKLIEGSQSIEKSIDTAATEFTHNASRTNESLQTSSDHLTNQTEVIKQHLQDAVSDLNTTMREMIIKLVDDAKDINSTLKDANSNLILDTKEVRNTFVQSSEQLQKQLQNMLEESAEEQVRQARRTFESMEQSVKQQVGLTGEAVEAQVAVIDQALQQEINRVMTEMGSSLAKIAGQFTNDYQKLTHAMQKVVREGAAA